MAVYIGNARLGRARHVINAGDQFNDWLVLEEIELSKPRTFKCKCKCGFIKEVHLSNLASGASSRCRQCAIRLHRGYHKPIF